MKNDRSYLDVFQRIIELSKGDNASNNIKNYLLRCDWDTIKVVQTAVYLGEDEDILARTANLWETLKIDIEEQIWETDKELEVRQISDKCEGTIPGEALERVINKFYK